MSREKKRGDRPADKHSQQAKELPFEDCVESALERVQSFLGYELGHKDQKALEKHLSNCSRLMETFGAPVTKN